MKKKTHCSEVKHDMKQEKRWNTKPVLMTVTGNTGTQSWPRRQSGQSRKIFINNKVPMTKTKLATGLHREVDVKN